MTSWKVQIAEYIPEADMRSAPMSYCGKASICIWSPERNPIFASSYDGSTLILTAKLLRPAVEELLRKTIYPVKMLRELVKIAKRFGLYINPEISCRLEPGKHDVEGRICLPLSNSFFDGAIFLDKITLLKSLQDLFDRFMRHEITDDEMNRIILSTMPESPTNN